MLRYPDAASYRTLVRQYFCGLRRDHVDITADAQLEHRTIWAGEIALPFVLEWFELNWYDVA